MSFDENSFLTGIVVGSAIRRRPKSQELPQALIFAGEGAFTLSITNAEKNWDGTLEYCRDLVHWNEWDGTTAISSGARDLLLLRGHGNTVITGAYNRGFVLSGSNVACRGSIEYLLDADDAAEGRHPEMRGGAFRGLFSGCTGLTEAPALPATELATNCYADMFSRCTGLTKAPALPATELVTECYGGIFSRCTSLTEAPALPATELAINCYSFMFYGCSGLTKAPALPATFLPAYCYYTMFEGCTSLEELPALSSVGYLDTYCCLRMFYGCTGIKLSQTKTGEYVTAYKIGMGSSAGGSIPTQDMFANTGGTFTGTPSPNITYYTSNEVIS